MDETQINQLPLAVSIDATTDWLAIDQATATNKINRNTLLGLSSNPVGINDNQTLTNKILTAPIINGGVLSGTLSGTYTLGGTPTFPSSIVTTTDNQTLTNKILTAPVINGGTISNSTISVDAINEYTANNGVTIDGLNIKNGILNSNNSVVTNNYTDGSITPNKLQSGSGTGWDWISWTPTWTNLTVGNGTLNYANYVQIGKSIFFRICLTLGGTSAVNGAISFSTPITPSATYLQNVTEQIGNGTALSPGVAQYGLVCYLGTGSTIRIRPMNAAGTYVNNNNDTSSTIPFTWGNTCIISAQGFYEVS